LVSGLIKTDAELRYHPLMLGPLDTYVGADVGGGLALMWDASRAGPHVGACAGVDLHPLRVVSLGVAARGGVAVFGTPQDGAQVFPESAVGVVLGFHVPSASAVDRASSRTTRPDRSAIAPSRSSGSRL
jgi:hypothetical protein